MFKNPEIQTDSLKIGNTEIGEDELKLLKRLSERELDILKRLANNQLKVAIKSPDNNSYIDHFYGRIDQGDRDRSIQFQHGPVGDWGKFTLELQ